MKLTLTDLTSLTNEQSALEAMANNNAAIEAAVEDTLSRSGVSPNTMNTTLDMNSKRIINLPAPLTLTEPVRMGDIVGDTFTFAAIPPGGSAGYALIKNTTADYDASWKPLGVTTTVIATGQTRTAQLTDNNKIVLRSNAGSNMQDALPAGGGAGVYTYHNDDVAGLYAITTSGGALLDGLATNYIVLGPDQTAVISSDGTSYHTVSAPGRARIATGTTGTIYVQATGSDTNPGVLSSLPKQTRQAIYDEMYQRYDLNEARMVIQHTGNFTDTGATLRGRPPGTGNNAATTPYAHAIHFLGNRVSPSSCTITSTGTCFNAINEATFHMDGFKLISSAGNCIASSYDSVLGVGAMEYGSAATYQVLADCGKLHFDDSYIVSGGAAYHMISINNGRIENQGGAIVCNMSGTPAFSGAVIGVQSGGLISGTSLTYAGAATGVRFTVGPFGGNANIGTFGTDPNTLIAGNANGTYSGNDGSMNGFSNTVYSSLTVSNLGTVSFVTTDVNKTLSSFPTANSGVLVTNGAGTPSISSTLPAVNGAALTSLNASNLGSGTVAAARMPAISGDGSTSAGATALTVTKINGVDQTTAWTTYSPTITAQSGTITTSSATGRYKQIGKTIILQVDVTITTAGTGANGLRATLPFTAAAFNYAGSCKTTTAGKGGSSQIGVSGTVLDMRHADGTTMIANGEEVVATITYEIP